MNTPCPLKAYIWCLTLSFMRIVSSQACDAGSIVIVIQYIYHVDSACGCLYTCWVYSDTLYVHIICLLVIMVIGMSYCFQYHYHWHSTIKLNVVLCYLLRFDHCSTDLIVPQISLFHRSHCSTDLIGPQISSFERFTLAQLLLKILKNSEKHLIIEIPAAFISHSNIRTASLRLILRSAHSAIHRYAGIHWILTHRAEC